MQTQSILEDKPLEAIIITEAQRGLRWLFAQGISQDVIAHYIGVKPKVFRKWSRGLSKPREPLHMALKDLMAITRLWQSKGRGISALEEAIQAGQIKELRDIFSMDIWDKDR